MYIKWKTGMQKKHEAKELINACIVVHICNPIPWEVEAGRPQGQGQPVVYSTLVWDA
jgi:hypothetical protein